MSSSRSESTPATRSNSPARRMYPTKLTAVASKVETTTDPRGLLKLSTGAAGRFRRETKVIFTEPHTIAGRFLSMTTCSSWGR